MIKTFSDRIKAFHEEFTIHGGHRGRAHSQDVRNLTGNFWIYRKRGWSLELDKIRLLDCPNLPKFHFKPGKSSDMLLCTEIPGSCIIRWYVYDTITLIVYRKSIEMVEEGRDVDDFIKSWHDMFRLGGLMVTFSWLIHSIISNSLLKKYLMPQKGHERGTGHIIFVSRIESVIHLWRLKSMIVSRKVLWTPSKESLTSSRWQ